MTKNKKKYAMFIPCKSLWAVLTGLFFAFFLFSVNYASARTFDDDFRISFGWDSMTEYTDFRYGISEQHYIGMSFSNYPDGKNKNLYWRLNEGEVVNSVINGNDYFDNNIHYVVIEKALNSMRVSIDGTVIRTTGLPTFPSGDLIVLNHDQIPVWAITDYCETTPCPVASTTPCYISNNQDIGTITGTSEYWNGTATTTEYKTFKIPAILYFFIFSIVAVIITIIIAWAYKR